MTLSTNGVLENVEILAHRLTSERRSGARGTVGRRLRRGRGDRLPPAAGSGVDGRAVGIHARSTRAVAHAISLIAAGDSSLALILSMEPVAMFVTGWLADFHADEADPTWLRQREEFVGLLASGADAWGGPALGAGRGDSQQREAEPGRRLVDLGGEVLGKRLGPCRLHADQRRPGGRGPAGSLRPRSA
ncbi:hypothetical protein OHQ89_43770 [Streptomyces canus]|uniref:hypothetical protein n=1 Tax=Streptomyces canus TaxID=58343 RepID=UPI0030E073A0